MQWVWAKNLAFQAGIPQTTIFHTENSVGPIKADTTTRLAQALDESSQALLDLAAIEAEMAVDSSAVEVMRIAACGYLTDYCLASPIALLCAAGVFRTGLKENGCHALVVLFPEVDVAPDRQDRKDQSERPL